MAEIRQKMRGTTVEVDQWIGLEGQLVVDVERHDIRYMDGVTMGGYRIANKAANDLFYLGILAQANDSARLNGQPAAFYQNAANLNAGILPAARFNDTTHGNRGGGGLHALVTGASHGFMINTDKTKLDGIEAGADVTDQTNVSAAINAGNIVAITGPDYIPFRRTADGLLSRLTFTSLLAQLNGGLIDAGTLDGLDSTAFARNNGVLNSTLRMESTIASSGNVAPYGTGISTSDISAATGYPAGMSTQATFWHNSNRSFQFITDINASSLYMRAYHSVNSWSSFYKVWTEANDGVGSGLDADLLDGMHSNVADVANTIVSRNANGDAFSRFFNMSHGIATRNADTTFYSSTDDYIRKNTAAGMRGSLAVPIDTTTITAGNGLTGGGNLQANRTLTLGTPSTLSGSTSNAVTATSHTHAVDFDGTLAGFAVGSIGSYAMLENRTASNISPGGTISGANTFYAAAGIATNSGTSPAGTWRCMGFAGSTGFTESDRRVSLFLRIS